MASFRLRDPDLRGGMVCLSVSTLIPFRALTWTFRHPTAKNNLAKLESHCFASHTFPVKFSKVEMVNARLLSQIIGSGAQIIGRAFVEAYKEAAAAGRHSIEAGAKGAADTATRKTGITIEEAAQILNVKKDSPVEDVVKRFEVMFKANDPKEGGSFYIQSKVVRARERFELEMARKAAESGPTPNP